MSAVSQAILRAHGNAGMRGTSPSRHAAQIHLCFGVIAKERAERPPGDPALQSPGLPAVRLVH